MFVLKHENVVRREDDRLLRGKGLYTADREHAGLLHAVVLRAPFAHARIAGADAAAARAMPGVAGVFLAADLDAEGPAELPAGVALKRPDGRPAPVTPRPVLARDTVRHLGEPVALVVAETLAAAQDAAEAVTIDYEPLPAVAEATDALRPGAPVVWPAAPDNIGFAWRAGDAAAARRPSPPRRMSRASTFASPASPPARSSPAPRPGGWMRRKAGGRDQRPEPLPAPRAAGEGLRGGAREVRVVAGDVGGSFGMKAGLYREEVLVLWAARRLGRPVRWVSGRSEAFLSDDQARDIDVRVALALDADARFQALRVAYDINVGAYLTGRSLAPLNNIGGVAGVYRIPAILAEARGVLTHTLPTAAYRGAGRPEATYAIERAVDAAALELGLDPLELRRRNLIPPEAMPYRTALTFHYDCGDFAAVTEDAARLADVAGFPARQRSGPRGRLRGLGVCNPIEPAGGPFGRPAKDMARIAIGADGAVVVRAGVMSVGQGLETAFVQMVASALGVPPERIRYEQGDTDQLPHGRGSGGSSALSVGGSALAIAVERVIEAGRGIAADRLEVAPADVEFAEGRYAVVGTDRTVPLAEVARLAAERDPEGLAAAGDFQPGEVTYPNGCHICEVEVDPETGSVEVVGYAAVEDVGRVLNPRLVEGQIHGGVAQGLGQALKELVAHDAEAQVLSGSFMDYGLPLATDLPPIRVATREVPTAVNPLGAKGVGEAGTVGALAAAMNAVLAALHPLGVRHLDMPASPPRVLAAVAAARGSG